MRAYYEAIACDASITALSGFCSMVCCLKTEDALPGMSLFRRRTPARQQSLRPTERTLKADAGMTLLASFSRKTEERSKRGVPVPSSLGKWGDRVFTKPDASKSSRSLMLLARPVP